MLQNRQQPSRIGVNRPSWHLLLTPPHDVHTDRSNRPQLRNCTPIQLLLMVSQPHVSSLQLCRLSIKLPIISAQPLPCCMGSQGGASVRGAPLVQLDAAEHQQGRHGRDEASHEEACSAAGGRHQSANGIRTESPSEGGFPNRACCTVRVLCACPTIVAAWS